MRYQLYVTAAQISRTNREMGDFDRVVFSRKVKANRPSQAVAIVADEIWQLCDNDIRVVSVYVGKDGSTTEMATRMQPIQIRR